MEFIVQVYWHLIHNQPCSGLGKTAHWCSFVGGNIAMSIITGVQMLSLHYYQVTKFNIYTLPIALIWQFIYTSTHFRIFIITHQCAAFPKPLQGLMPIHLYNKLHLKKSSLNSYLVKSHPNSSLTTCPIQILPCTLSKNSLC